MLRRRPVEKECGRRLDYVFSELVPSIGLREDVLGEALGTEAAVSFLSHFKY